MQNSTMPTGEMGEERGGIVQNDLDLRVDRAVQGLDESDAAHSITSIEKLLEELREKQNAEQVGVPGESDGQTDQTDSPVQAQIEALNETLEKLKEQRALEIQRELLNTEAVRELGLTEADLDNMRMEMLEGDDLTKGSDGSILQRDAEGKQSIQSKKGEFSLATNLILIALLAYDLTKGGRSIHLIGNLATEWVMMKLGVDPETTRKFLSSSNPTEGALFAFTPIELKHFLENRIQRGYRDEVVEFLAGLSDETRLKLMMGEDVFPNGKGRHAHKLEPEMKRQILDFLRPVDIQRLKLERALSNQQQPT